jgi:TetR/AcrR family transcriptional regulator
MTDQEKNTEDKIFDAANTVFIKKGYDGARMQEIAEEAGINKALLHYYYRTKDKLFDTIFEKILETFFPKVFEFMKSDMDLFQKLEFFIDNYIDFIQRNPFIPGFVVHEISRNPDRIVNFLGHRSGLIKSKAFQGFAIGIEEEVKKGTIRPIKAEHLVVNMIGLCIFPILAKPILKGILFEGDEKAINAFLDERKKQVKEFVFESIKVK